MNPNQKPGWDLFVETVSDLLDRSCGIIGEDQVRREKLKMRQITYLAVLEPSTDGYGVYFPDLPGCGSWGGDISEVRRNAREALELHIYGMEKDGEMLPVPSQCLAPEDTGGHPVFPVTASPDDVEGDRT